jgi:hypothetical protein
LSQKRSFSASYLLAQEARQPFARGAARASCTPTCFLPRKRSRGRDKRATRFVLKQVLTGRQMDSPQSSDVFRAIENWYGTCSTEMDKL